MNKALPISKSGWTATYESDDFGTERLLTVRDSEGNIIGQKDPFYPAGIPVDKRRRDRRIKEAIRDIILEYQQKQFEKPPTNPRKSKFLERETMRTSRAKTPRGFISDVVRAFDDVIEKGWGEQELTVIHHPKYDRTVEERLLAGEDVAFNSKMYGYDLRPEPGDGFIYVYYRELPPGEEDLFPLIY